MRMIPLKREVRRVARFNRTERPTRDYYSRWIVLGTIYVVTVLLTCTFTLYDPPSPKAGETLEESNLRAWTDFDFVLRSSLEDWEQRRKRFHQRVWTYDSEVVGQVRKDLADLISTATALDPVTQSPEQLRLGMGRKDSRLHLTDENVVDVVRLLKDSRFQQTLRAIVNDAYAEHLLSDRSTVYESQFDAGITRIEPKASDMDNVVEVAQEVLPADFNWYEWSPLVRRILNEEYIDGPPAEDVREALRIVLGGIIRPNLTFNEEATQRAKESFPQGNLATEFYKGEELLTPQSHDGPREVTSPEAELLEAHANAVAAIQFKRLIGHAIFVLLAFVILSFYVRKFSREVAFSTHNVLLISLPVLIGLTVQAFCILLADGNASAVGYLFPAGAVGMLGVLLLDVRMALLLITWGCLLFGLQVDLEWHFVIVGLFGGYTAIAAIYSIRKRYEVFIASTLIALVNAAVILIMAFIRDPETLPLGGAALGLIAGMASFLVLAVLPVIERFGIITDMQLLELTGLHNPLLRQVEELAPGTWQHTLNVAKLAEAAAVEIGVNYLLIRAGVYYHDIGKTKKPEYFTENQLTKEEKMLHQNVKPIMSTFVIKNHVKEGVEMAKKEGLPERIIDFISQHHGTSVITYFYHKALEASARGETKDPVRIEDYRYPGPKPQTIEAAIVMLADSVEATATAKLSNRTVREDDIQQVVRTTIFDKFNDGQFDRCNLTLRDLNTIREVFVRVLKSRFHTRIDYPKKPSAKAKREKEEEKPRQEPAAPTSKSSSGEIPLRAQS